MFNIIAGIQSIWIRTTNYRQLSPTERATLRFIDHLIIAAIAAAIVYLVRVYALGQPADTTTLTESGLVMAILSGVYKYATAQSDPKLIEDEPPSESGPGGGPNPSQV